MAKGNNLQDLSQIDYCLQQYYSKYMAVTLLQERKKILQEQKNAAIKLNESLQRLPNFGAASNSFTKLNDAEQLTKKSLDELAARTSERWFKDPKIVKDYSVFVTSFYESLVAKNGGRDSKALENYANNYCANRLQKLMVEQLAREQVPANTATYIAKKAFSESILGMGNFGSLKKGAIGQKVDEQAEKYYNPSVVSKTAGTIAGYGIDAALTPGGVGKATSSVAKGVVKVSQKAAGWWLTDKICQGGLHIYGKLWGTEDEEKKDNRTIFGDENASAKIQAGAKRYKKNGTELMMNINSGLAKKIKLPPPNTSLTIKKESNALLAEHKGNSQKLLSTIKSNLSKQSVPFNGNSKVPAWMLSNSSKQNRALASSFYACAMEMSREQKQVRMFGGKKMTLKEVSQRAYDYARAAVAVEQQTSKNAAHAQKGTWDKNMSALNDQINNPGLSSIRKHPTSSPQATPTASPYASGPYAQNGVMGTEANGTTQNTAQNPNIGGWGNAFESLGLNGFGDIGKNLGYVLAMLPDMIIGMFTGKTPNLKLQDNLMPLAAIVGGMFVKSPLLKLLLIGFGGANILNKAGHAAISDGLAKSNNVAKTYKVYPDEPLNSRIVNPAMKGSSMIATIDGVPSVINISRDAADAYNKGAIPINTLANAVLRKYDENKALASQNYEQHMSQEETTTQSMGIK